MEQLYREYEKSLEIQNKVIKTNTEKLRRARASCNCKEIKRLNTLLRTLYEEKYELEEKSRALGKYIGVI